MYNGHRNYNAWNVSLWLNNVEDNYRLMQYCIKTTRTRMEASKKMMMFLPETTPDNVKFSVTNVRLSMVGM